MTDVKSIIEKYYSHLPKLAYILIRHSEQVRDKALGVASRHPELRLDEDFIAEAAMLHDIGIFMTNAPRIFCHGSYQYIEHGYLGADLLRKEGLELHALVCERHTGVGISLDKIVERQLPLPARDMRPVSVEEQVICYADKFFSKTELNTMHSIDRIRTSLRHHGEEDVFIFDAWHERFG